MAEKRANLGKLAVRHHGSLFGYCRRRLGTESEAEDAVQETFMRAFRYWDSYDPSRDARKWLFGIAHNVCVELARKRAKLTIAEDLPEPVDMKTSRILENLTREEHIESVRQALGKLSDRARRIIELRFFGQMNSRDIAELEGMSEPAVRVALHRALEGLRGRLAGKADDHATS